MTHFWLLMTLLSSTEMARSTSSERTEDCGGGRGGEQGRGGAGGGQMPEMGQLMQMVIPPPAVLFVFVNYYCHRSLRVRFADHGRCLQMAGIMQLPEEERNAMLAQVRSRRPIPTAW